MILGYLFPRNASGLAALAAEAAESQIWAGIPTAADIVDGTAPGRAVVQKVIARTRRMVRDSAELLTRPPF